MQTKAINLIKKNFGMTQLKIAYQFTCLEIVEFDEDVCIF